MAGRRSKPAVPRIVAVAGGKGGVGKSTVAVNLAVAISQLGHRVTLVDADLGAANLHTMLGVINPTTGLGDFLDHRVETLDALRTQVLVPTLSLVPGTSRPGAANLTKRDKLRLLGALARVDAECVIVDVGAGSSYNVVDIIAAADHKLLVLTPQLTSLHNAYALLKACVHRVVRRLALDEVEQRLIDAALAQDTKARTIAQLLDVLRPLDPILAERIADTLGRFGVAIVGNQIETTHDTGALSRMSPLIQDHLSVQAPLIAAIARSTALQGGLRAGSGSLATSTAGGTAFRKLAQEILRTDLEQLRGEERTSAHHTQPLWIRCLAATDLER
jgi:flagellar biosynthesis protein FlhG